VIACTSSAQRSLTRCVLKLCYHDPLLTGLGQTLTGHAICGCTTVSSTYTRGVKAQVGCHEPVYLPSFSPSPMLPFSLVSSKPRFITRILFPTRMGSLSSFSILLQQKHLLLAHQRTRFVTPCTSTRLVQYKTAILHLRDRTRARMIDNHTMA
jgi:hypothetical protein